MSKRNARKVQIARHVIATIAEAWTLAEIVYYYTHDGEETLHGKLADYLRHAAERVNHRAQVEDTLEMIRDLPERGDAE